MAWLPPRAAMARVTAKMAVTSATRRLNRFSACSCSSSGLGSSTSGMRSVAGAAPRDLLFHGRASRLEGGGQPLGLLLEVLTPLVEEVAGPILRLARRLLGPLEQVAAVLGEQLAGLAPGLGRQQHGRRRARDSAEEKPSQIARRVASTLVTHGLLLFAGPIDPRGQ